jgi:hypothetical protein
MVDGRVRLAIAVVAVLAGVSQGQPRNAAVQSPRQAMVEMFSGGEAPFKKHLTLEMQRKLQEVMKGPSSNGVPLQAFAMAASSDPDRFQAFDLGPILFSFNNPDLHERYEIKIDSEQARADEDAMELSLHYMRNGVEQQTPFALRFVLNMKRQEGTWRLDAVTLSATLPIGDPRIMDQSWWGPAALLAANGAGQENSSAVVLDDRPKLSPLRAVRMIGMAENIYAQNHPGIGYTCKLADLVNVGKGLDEDGVYKFMDAAFAGGTYNGYHFTISGCEHRPVRTFRVMAEPVAGKGKAYCSDHTNNLRASDDGRGTTCLVSGKLARK